MALLDLIIKIIVENELAVIESDMIMQGIAIYYDMAFLPLEILKDLTEKLLVD